MNKTILYLTSVLLFFFSCNNKKTNEANDVLILRTDSINECLLKQKLDFFEIEDDYKEITIQYPNVLKMELHTQDSISLKFFESVDSFEISAYKTVLSILSIPKDSVVLNGCWINNDEEGYRPDFRFLTKEKKLIFFEDIDNDGNDELIILDRMSNGNMYNVAVKHIFAIKNSKIIYIGCFEYITYLPFSDEFIHRKWQNKRVNVFLSKTLDEKNKIFIGSYSMILDTVTNSIKIDSLKPSEAKYTDVLVGCNM
jgi:hypothetical protein